MPKIHILFFLVNLKKHSFLTSGVFWFNLLVYFVHLFVYFFIYFLICDFVSFHIYIDIFIFKSIHSYIYFNVCFINYTKIHYLSVWFSSVQLCEFSLNFCIWCLSWVNSMHSCIWVTNDFLCHASVSYKRMTKALIELLIHQIYNYTPACCCL